MSPERKSYLSKVMSTYNKAKAAARQGKLDEKRVNRALGILLSGNASKYLTTTRSCSCPDAANGHICKHRIAAMITARMG